MENVVTGQVVGIPLDDIFADETLNCRGKFDPTSVSELAASIEQRGKLIQPVRVCPMLADYNNPDNKKYLLIMGYRRFMAHRILMINDPKWSKIDAIVDSTVTSEIEVRYMNLAENLDRKDLTILEEARSIEKLRTFGISEVDAASQLKKSRGWVQIRFMLLDLPEEVQAECEAGVITQTQIRELYTIKLRDGEDACYEAARTYKEKKAKGHKNINIDSKKTKKNAKRIRNKGEIFELMEYIQQDSGLGNGVWTRMLAWTAGEIDDNEMHLSLKMHANENGLTYRIPQYVK
jgi:ParB/RepB/Spo0J family partition protein